MPPTQRANEYDGPGLPFALVWKKCAGHIEGAKYVRAVFIDECQLIQLQFECDNTLVLLQRLFRAVLFQCADFDIPGVVDNNIDSTVNLDGLCCGSLQTIEGRCNIELEGGCACVFEVLNLGCLAGSGDDMVSFLQEREGKIATKSRAVTEFSGDTTQKRAI